MTDSQVKNPFSTPDIGERYDRFRPRYHHIPVRRIADRLGSDLCDILDVGCGTGHSTMALAAFFKGVRGCDLSSQMLEIARRNREIEFDQADSAKLPFSDSTFSLVTVFMGFHWFNQADFLTEARRVLKNPGFLAIDDFGFSGTMITNQEFKPFYREFYFKRFPATARNSVNLTDVEMTKYGFEVVDEFNYTLLLDLDIEKFISFLQTQSNLLTEKNISSEEVGSLLTSKFSPYFKKRSQKLEFGGALRLYKVV